MAGSKRRRIALEALESRALLSAMPAHAASVEVSRIDPGSTPISGRPIDGIISGTTGVDRGQVPVNGKGYVFPLVGVSSKGTFTTSGTPGDLNIGGTLTLIGRQGNLVIDLGADGVQSSVGTGTTAYAVPFTVQVSVVSATGRFANEQGSGTGVLELDSVLGGVTPKPVKGHKVNEAVGAFVLSLHLEPPPTS